MKILVTGGTGFLGQHVKKEFEKHAVTTIYISATYRDGHIACDLVDIEEVRNAVYVTSPDVILHMAALCGGILANRNSPADFLTTNLKMGLNVFDVAKTYQEDFNKKIKVYTLGTVCGYPKHCPVPFKEDDLWNGYPEETNAPYGHAKRTLLMLQNTYRQQYGIGGAHLIPVNLYGEHDHFNLTNSHVIPALIRKFIDAAENNKNKVELWGTGSATREFLYAGDAAKAIVDAMINKLDTELPINIGAGRDISIRELAEQIAKLCGYKGEIVYDSTKPDGQPKRMLDVLRAKKLLEFDAKTSLLKGLVKTICWYQENRNNIED